MRERIHVPADGPDEEPGIDAAAQLMARRLQDERVGENDREDGVGAAYRERDGEPRSGDLAIW